MTIGHVVSRHPHVLSAALVLLALLASPTASAQYKVVGPDGRVTYTDRPPAAAAGRATELARRGVSAGTSVTLPLELRQVVSRYPVTLFVSASACQPCDSGRQLLRQRGIPFTERQIVRPEDSDALERLTGSRDAPTLTIGTQAVKGWSPDLWSSYLDAAGYPSESRLPSNYEYPPATPLTEARDAAPRTAGAPAQPPTRDAAPDTAPVAPPPTPGGIRF